MKECLNAFAETLFEGKQKDDMCEKIKQIPMSASTATRKSEILADDVLAQLDAAIQSAPCISLTYMSAWEWHRLHSNQDLNHWQGSPMPISLIKKSKKKRITKREKAVFKALFAFFFPKRGTFYLLFSEDVYFFLNWIVGFQFLGWDIFKKKQEKNVKSILCLHMFFLKEALFIYCFLKVLTFLTWKVGLQHF